MKTQEPARVMLPTERELVITRTFDAPAALVFDMWTNAQHVAHWWDPSGVPLAACEIDLRPGGAFRFVHGFAHGAAGGSAHAFAGVYREVDPPSRLVFTTQSPSGAASTGTLVFSTVGKATLLTMTIACESKSDRDALLAMRVDAGTAQTLDNLDAYLSRSAEAT